MSNGFNVAEVFQMAEQIERNGAKFYRRAAKEFKDKAGRNLLLDLAAMEVEHERIFAEMREDFRKRGAAVPVFDPYDEGVLYLRAIADGHVFDVKVDPSERLTGKETVRQILNMAIGLEKDSVVFYEGIRQVVPDDLGKERVEAIIREEMRHISLLSGQLASVKE